MYLLIIFVLGVLPTLLAFMAARLERGTNVASPLHILGWCLLLGYTLKSLYLLYAIPAGSYFRTDDIARDIVHLGQFGILVGTVSFLAGFTWYQSITRRATALIPIIDLPRFDPRIYYYPMLLGSVGLMSVYFVKMGFLEQVWNLNFSPTKFFTVETTGVATSLGYLTQGADFIIVAALYYFVFSKRLSLFNVYTLSILFIALCFFLASRRNGVLLMIILFLLIVGARNLNLRRVIKFKHFVIMGCVMALLSFASQIRQERGGTVLANLDFATAIEITTQHAMQGAYFMDPAKTAAIMQEADRRNEILYGQSFLVAVLVPIPRIVWPEKPLIRVGPYVAQDLLGIQTRSGIPPAGIGELYINFRWPGVVFGMFLVGLLSALAWRRCLRTADPRFARPPYALAMMCLIIFLVADFSAALITFVKYQIAIAVCEAYWRRRLNERGDETTARLVPIAA